MRDTNIFRVISCLVVALLVGHLIGRQLPRAVESNSDSPSSQLPQPKEEVQFLTETETASGDDFPKLWSRASGEPDERLRRVLLDQISIRWAKQSPQVALDWLLANEVPKDEILAFFLNWAEIDPDAAISAAGNHPDLNAAPQILSRLARRRPADFFRLVSTYSDALQGYRLQLAESDAWHALALADPAAAIERLGGSSADKNKRNAAAKQIGSALARHSGFAALGTITGITDAGLRRSALHSALEILADIDPVNASREFREHHRAMDRKSAMFALVRGLSQHAPESLLETLRADGWVGADHKSKIFSYNDASSMSGGAAALHAFLVLGGDPQDADTLIEMNRGSVAAQVAFANNLFELPKDSSRDLLIQEALALWTSDDLAGAREFAEGIEDQGLRNQALDGLLNSEHSHRLGVDAREIVAGIDGHVLSDGALEGLTRADPEFAVEYLSTMPEEDRERATRRVFTEMGDVDGAEGARLLENCTDPEVCRFGAHRLMENWLDNDPRAASEWVASLDDGPTRQGAADRISSYHHGTLEGFVWSTVLLDPALRSERLSQAAVSWAGKDPQAALEGITNSERITDTERATLLNLIPQP